MAVAVQSQQRRPKLCGRRTLVSTPLTALSVIHSVVCRKGKKGGGGPSDKDKDKLKVAGAAVAVAAALVFGGVKVYKVVHTPETWWPCMLPQSASHNHACLPNS